MSLVSIETASALRAQVASWRNSGLRVALVPTMGNLHAGHMQLIQSARAHGDKVLCSIFVNPTQFGPNEDFARYPRTLESDCAALWAHGCDAVFAPSAKSMYPEAPRLSARIVLDDLREQLCGSFRPGHFDAVATVVAKLFNLCLPDVALFGEKDYQQLTVIRSMVKALDFPVQVVGVPTVRERNGLAMSSRNQYLSAAEREKAGQIFAELNRVAAAVSAGADRARVLMDARDRLSEHGFRLDYLELRDAITLLPLPVQRGEVDGEAGGEGVGDGVGEAVALVAVHLGRARLIDNLRFSLQ